MMTKNCSVDELTEQMALMNVQCVRRENKQMTMPDPELVVAFEKQMCEMTNIRITYSVKQKERKAIDRLGIPMVVAAKLWELIFEFEEEEPPFADLTGTPRLEHLLWALVKLKSYSSEGDMADLCGCKSPKTFRKWASAFIEQLALLTDRVIVWDDRKIDGDEGDNIYVSVDCTDCPFQQVLMKDPENPKKKVMNKALYSYKIGPALRYEVAVALATNRIVWIHGPFLPGKYNDLEIFRHGLMHMLDDRERVFADKIYVAEAPEKVVCVGMVGKVDEDLLKRVEGRHESLNRRLKLFRCLSIRYLGRGNDFKNKILDHSNMFRAVCVATNVAMELGYKELYKI